MAPFSQELEPPTNPERFIIFWYRGLALGGIAGVGQLQLLQPFFGLALAGVLLHEPVAWTMVAATGLVVLCVAGAKRFA